MYSDVDKRMLLLCAAIVALVNSCKEKKPMSPLPQQDVITTVQLPKQWGCDHLFDSMKKIHALPQATDPRQLPPILDTRLVYRQFIPEHDARYRQVIHSVHNASNQMAYVDLQLTKRIFNPPGPDATFEKLLGPPKNRVNYGSKPQWRVSWWTSHCQQPQSSATSDVAVTLYVAEETATVWLELTEGTQSERWEEIIAAANQHRSRH